MSNLISSLSVADKVQIISIASTLLISIVSISIALATLIQTKKSTVEANRAYIVLFIKKDRDEIFHSIIIKNFGKTSGILKKISLDPPLSYANTRSSINIKSITEYQNIYLAPNQSIMTLFDFRNYKDKIFNATVTYTCNKRTYTDTYTLDLNYFASILTSSSTINDSIDALKHIDTSLKRISDKMD